MWCGKPVEAIRDHGAAPSDLPQVPARRPDASSTTTRRWPLAAGHSRARRGVTLVEMLVTLAILLLMMTVIVQIFQAATGALNAAQVYQDLDNQLRLLFSTVRSDLSGITCKMTPPNDPKNNPGYCEYGENEFADVQGEDSDDYIRFTAKAPAGQPFTGRMWVRSAYNTVNGFIPNQSPQPITITSDHAEIIYFLRNGNLYRRVLLVVPELQSTVEPAVNNLNPNAPFNNAGFFPPALGGNPANLTGNQVSWQGVNDLSARPSGTGAPFHGNSVLLNTLGDLASREKRFAYQRFSDDFYNLGTGGGTPDGLSDDLNGDNVPDYYPTLYPTVLSPTNVANTLLYYPGVAPTGFPWPPPHMAMMAFPFVFPGAYSVPQSMTTAAYGWIHSPNPEVNVGTPLAPVAATYEGNTLGYLNNLNHNPLDTGDNVAVPANQSGYVQTWWGFPTWRETLSPFWVDPTYQINTNLTQPTGLGYIFANAALPAGTPLPAMTGVYRNTPQPYNDLFGTPSVFFPLTGGNPPSLWSQYSWEDDLVMTGVRSFDIKAYDNSLGAYADLGWGDDPRLTQNLSPQYLGTNLALPYLAGNYDPVNGYAAPAYAYINANKYDLLNQTLAHEGRMPPLVNDNRFDAQFGAVVPGYYSGYPNYNGNIGDNNPAVVRLRRVWDSWSTEYTQAPGTGVYPAGSVAPFFPAGPPYSPPIYPSYPPPYPAPLRGIQIQIRVTDPTNQRIKTLTIRQDFTDKL